MSKFEEEQKVKDCEQKDNNNKASDRVLFEEELEMLGKDCGEIEKSITGILNILGFGASDKEVIDSPSKEPLNVFQSYLGNIERRRYELSQIMVTLNKIKSIIE